MKVAINAVVGGQPRIRPGNPVGRVRSLELVVSARRPRQPTRGEQLSTPPTPSYTC